MSVIIVLIIIGILVAGTFLIGFIWAAKSGQYDETYSPSVRMLFEDTKPVKKKAKTTRKTAKKRAIMKQKTLKTIH